MMCIFSIKHCITFSKSAVLWKWLLLVSTIVHDMDVLFKIQFKIVFIEKEEGGMGNISILLRIGLACRAISDSESYFHYCKVTATYGDSIPSLPACRWSKFGNGEEPNRTHREHEEAGRLQTGLVLLLTTCWILSIFSAASSPPFTPWTFSTLET